MKRTRLRKKSLAKTVFKKLYKECEKSWIKAINRRDKVCQLCSNTAGNCLQADHCFSRTVSRLFFDVRNGTLLCSSCHTKKTFGAKAFDKKVDSFVKAREGEEFWNWATHIAESLGSYKWSYDELENLKNKLDFMYLV